MIASQQPGSGSIIGSTDPNAASTAQFQHFWNELAGRFVNNEKVIFGIMNEPHDMPTPLVVKNDQAAITGIRNSGARQLVSIWKVLVPSSANHPSRSSHQVMATQAGTTGTCLLRAMHQTHNTCIS
jgi:aryl-phospho-beta-D-glucosidase BglC (GH1 family)